MAKQRGAVARKTRAIKKSRPEGMSLKEHMKTFRPHGKDWSQRKRKQR